MFLANAKQRLPDAHSRQGVGETSELQSNLKVARVAPEAEKNPATLLAKTSAGVLTYIPAETD